MLTTGKTEAAVRQTPGAEPCRPPHKPGSRPFPCRAPEGTPRRPTLVRRTPGRGPSPAQPPELGDGGHRCQRPVSGDLLRSGV